MSGAKLTALAALSLLSGCDPSCRDGTLFLTVRLGPSTQGADQLHLRLTIGGQLEEEIVPHTPGGTTESFEIDFSSHYPSGQSAAISVDARLGGQVIGTGSAMANLPAGCGTIDVTVADAPPAPDAGALPDLVLPDLASPVLAGSQRNLAFVASTKVTPMELVMMGNGDPLAGGDLLCQNAATDGQLPGHYVALLAATGKSAANRLSGARGWWRVDGLPFADLPQELFLAGQIFYGLRLDELGIDEHGAGMMTAANSDGTPSGNNTCANWTAFDGKTLMTFGLAGEGRGRWLNVDYRGCDGKFQIYCFGTDYNQPVSFTPATGRTAFMGARWVPGGGIMGADSACNQQAQDNNIPGNFQALLATDTFSATSRFDLTGLPWVRPDGVLITKSTFDLAQGAVLSSINLTADGLYVNDVAWSGNRSLTQIPTTGTCTNWTVSSANAVSQATYAAHGYGLFSDAIVTPCSQARYIYCLEN
jgi:hypothetical protein